MKRIFAVFMLLICLGIHSNITVHADETTNIEDYYLLNYIETNKQSYIMTDYYTNAATKITADFQYLSTATNQRIVGVNDATSNVNIVMYITGNGNIGYRYGSRGYGVIGGTSGIVPPGTSRHTFSLWGTGGQYDGITWSHSNSYTGVCTAPLGIFAQVGGSGGEWVVTPSSTGAYMRLYSLKIWDNNGNTMRKNFVPAQRKTDRINGLYDLQNDVFWPSSNGVNFTSGGYAGSVTLTLETQEGGSVSGEGTTYKSPDGSSYFTAVAEAETGYTFVGWYSDSERTTLVSNQTTYNFSSSSDFTLYAKFIPSYSISIPSSINLNSGAAIPVNYEINGGTVGIDVTSVNDWNLINGSNRLSYNLNKTSFTITKGTGTENLAVNIAGVPPIAGTYYDQLTFIYGVGAISLPEKGDIITLDGTSERYRVLSRNGYQTKVMSLDFSVSTLVIGSTDGSTTSFGETEGVQYAGSDLDSYLNETYYESLSQNIKNAIIDQNIKQGCYSRLYGDPEEGYFAKYYFSNYTVGNYTSEYFVKLGETDIGLRHVYVMDIQDIKDYFGETYTSNDIRTLFNAYDGSVFTWTRSATNESDKLFTFRNDNGRFTYTVATVSDRIRPMFVIDLSKVGYSVQS